MPQMTGVECLQHAAKIFPDAQRRLLAAYADTSAAIIAIDEASVRHRPGRQEEGARLALSQASIRQYMIARLWDNFGFWRTRCGSTT
jgi:hypothetical protein